MARLLSVSKHWMWLGALAFVHLWLPALALVLAFEVGLVFVGVRSAWLARRLTNLLYNLTTKRPT